MTIEEKAKAYDDALENAKYYHDGMGDDVKCVLEEVFSELRESEDESEDDKIRRAILNTVKYYHFKESPYMFGISKEQVIAWLEKQGEHANFISKIQIGDKVTRNEGGVLVNISQLNRIAKKRKKQGDMKASVVDFKAKDWYVSKVDGKIHNIYYSADKIEPKFKVGDWIITKANNLCQITAIIDNNYQLKYGDNYSIQKCSDVDKNARLLNDKDVETIIIPKAKLL